MKRVNSNIRDQSVELRGPTFNTAGADYYTRYIKVYFTYTEGIKNKTDEKIPEMQGRI